MEREEVSEAGVLGLEFPAPSLDDVSQMPLHPDAQQRIKPVEDLSGRMVHVTEDPDLKVMATILTARALRRDSVVGEEQRILYRSQRQTSLQSRRDSYAFPAP